MTRLHLLVAVVVGVVVGCGGDVEPADGGPGDAGSDAARFDSGGNDDAGESDAGDIDAGDVDAGDVDAGDVDAGDVDAGESDAGPGDAGPPPVDGGPCVLERATRTANATSYTASPPRGTACGAGLPEDLLRTAVSPAMYMSGARCGTCMRVTGAAGTALVVIDDLCPECATHDLDLPRETLMLLTGTPDGREPVSWQLVPCEPTGNIQYDLQGSNPWFLKIRVSEHTTPVTSLEVRLAGGTFVAGTRTIDGFFQVTPGEMLPLPLTVRVTDSFGSQVEFTVPDLTNDLVRDTGVQLPVMCAP